jgi:hypothetical protein
MYSGTIIPDDQLSGIPDEISAHDKVVAIAILLNERLWFVDKPLVERVSLLCEQYAQQQVYLEEANDKLSKAGIL